MELLDKSNASDIDGDPISFEIAEIKSGSLQQYDGNGWIDATEGSTTLAEGDRFRWLGEISANGTTDGFSVKASDGALKTAQATVATFEISASNDGDAKVGLSNPTGRVQVGELLSVVVDQDDPDGNPLDGFNYSWQWLDETNNEWKAINSMAAQYGRTYYVEELVDNKIIRGKAAYRDAQGFETEIVTDSIQVITDTGKSIYNLAGSNLIGEKATVELIKEDPDKEKSNIEITWEYNSGNGWTHIGDGEELGITNDIQGGEIRANIQYLDHKGFVTSVYANGDWKQLGETILGNSGQMIGAQIELSREASSLATSYSGERRYMTMFTKAMD